MLSCIPAGACGRWPQRGVWHPSGLPALGAKGCVAVAQGAMAVVGAFKKKGRQYDKTFTTGLSPVGKQANLASLAEMHPFCLRHLPRRGRF